MKIFRFIVVAIFIWLLNPAKLSFAQDASTYPIYIVQNGDTLSQIAQRFNISVDQIIQLNSIQNPDSIPVGTSLQIPGYEGLEGTLEFHTISLGESFIEFGKKTQISTQALIRLNRITSPGEIYAGSDLITLNKENIVQLFNLGELSKSDDLLSKAITNIQNPWTLTFLNQLPNSWAILPGELIYSNNKDSPTISESNLVESISINPLPLIQGKTTVIKIITSDQLILSGSLGNQSLSFLDSGNNQYVSLSGIHAMESPGLATFSVTGSKDGNEVYHFEQKCLLVPGNFTQETVNGVDSSTIDPNVTQQEDGFLMNQMKNITPIKYWSGEFRYPVDEPCIGSRFGNRRSYNNGAYLYFHTGVDFTVCSANNTNIYASAPGVVVFAGPLPIHGNFTIIDHGWGVYSGYAHQSQFLIKVGDQVQAGQVIGLIGNTGRSVGYHLHWEIWVNGIQVNPLDWISNIFP